MNPSELTELEMAAVVAKAKGISILAAAELIAKVDAIVIDTRCFDRPPPPPNNNNETTVTE